MTEDELFQNIKESFEIAEELITDMAKEQRADIDGAVIEEEQRELKKRRVNVKADPVSALAQAYGKEVHDWFEVHRQLFEEKRKNLEEEVLLGIGDPETTAAEILDAAEVIRWHQYQISAKVMRALTGKQEEKRDIEFWEEYQRDSDGSAKVALIGIDRSIRAWKTLRSHLENESETMASMVEDLERLRKIIEEKFPKARSFVRPGFDQEE